MRHLTLKKLLLALLVGSLLLTAPALLAQEETAPETSQSVPGISTLVFLLGAGAIIVVGGAMIARDNFRSDDDTSA